jgi:hypothetical protein
MQLRTARLCLDCEEVHAEWRCPVCASASFTYLTRWIPVEDRRLSATRQAPALTVPPPRNGSRWITRGAMGVALVAASRLLWHVSRPAERPNGSSSSPDHAD